MVAKILGAIYSFFQRLLGSALGFIADLGGYLINGLITALKLLFKPVLILIGIIFYLIYQLGTLIVLLLKVLLGIGKLVYAFVQGLLKTLTGMIWTTTTPPSHGSWSAPIREVFAALAPYQLDKIAYVIMFAIWITTAVAAIRILSSYGGGGSNV
jgi:hypothetical protein